jgi:hypothetical protein
MSYSPAIDRMMASLRPRLPGALDGAIQNELFIVVDEFLRGSLAWREKIEVQMQVGVCEYDVVPDQSAIILQLMGVKDITECGRGIRAGMPEPGVLKIQCPPTQADLLLVEVSLTVNAPTSKDGYPLVPLWLCDRYAQTAWLDGVLGKMMSQPAKPYSNQQMASFHLKRFRGWISKAKVARQHANVYRGQNWQFPQQFNVRHWHGG